MTFPELKLLVARGEGSHLEFKKRTPGPEKIAREIVALTNSGSGKILIGIDDDGAILGVKDTAEEEYAVRKAVRDWVFPELRWNFRTIAVSRKREVLVLSIPTGRSGPHLVRNSLGNDRGTMYVRFDDESVVASPEAYMIASAPSSPASQPFVFGAAELLAMELVESDEIITVRGLANHAKISRFQARTVLVTLTLSGVLRHEISRPEDFFVVACVV
ncbi:MAG: ATP-binding protein [Bacteroidetes bacterium]|nr:MAG: ATP-binding protein [Bacteroidota bacterium]